MSSRKSIFLTLLLAILAIPALGQQTPQPDRNIVKGRVLDPSGEPVIGCVIVPDGASQKAVKQLRG